MGANSESDEVGSLGNEFMRVLPIMHQLSSKYSSSLTHRNNVAIPQEEN